MSDTTLFLEGSIIDIKNQEQVSASFTKREFVIETNGQYPQFVKFELVQDKCDLIDAYNKGDQVKVSFNVRGRKWTNKDGKDVYFVSLNAWRIETTTERPKVETVQTSNAPVSEALNIDDVDDMPF
tara:strand:+ start:5189 stop:5566 length:378 start_codon:yes stop_codon:yes gene_type:complete